MVLGSHCSAHPITHLRHDSWQFALVYLLQRLSFVSVYGFFLLSGLKLTLPRDAQPTLGAYYRGRLRTVFLPYLIAVAVYYWWFCGFLRYFPPSVSGFLGYLVRGNLSSPFYFIIALAQFVLLMPLWRYLSARCHAAIVLPFALGITWLSALWLGPICEFLTGHGFAYGDRVFTTYLFYYLAGCYIGRRYDDFLALLQSSRGMIVALFACFTAADLYGSYQMAVRGRSVPFLEMLHFLYLPAAILFCFLVAARIGRPLPPLLAEVEKASFLVYLYHALAISALGWALECWGVGGVAKPYAIRLAVVYLAVPALCVLWQRRSRRLTSFARIHHIK